MQHWFIIIIIILHYWLGYEDRLYTKFDRDFHGTAAFLGLPSWEEAAQDVAFLRLLVGYTLRHL